MFKFCLLLFPGGQKTDEMVEVFGSAVDTMAEEETAFQGVVFFRVFGKVSRKYFFSMPVLPSSARLAMTS